MTHFINGSRICLLTSIHDVHTWLKAPKIYEAFAVNTSFPEEKYSGDITLPSWVIDNAIIQTRIHKRDTVSAILGCSQEPFPLDFSGIIAFFTALGQIRGGLVWTLVSIYSQDITKVNKMIPPLSDWIIPQWHFGRDSLREYSGKDFHITVEKAGQILRRYYVKDLKGKPVLRDETVQRVNKNPYKAINGALELINSNSSKSPSTDLPKIGTYQEE